MKKYATHFFITAYGATEPAKAPPQLLVDVGSVVGMISKASYPG